MQYIEVYFCQQSEFGGSADSSTVYNISFQYETPLCKYLGEKASNVWFCGVGGL